MSVDLGGQSVPQCTDLRWHYVPVRRGTQDKNRRPLISEPENLVGRQDNHRMRAWAASYWTDHITYTRRTQEQTELSPVTRDEAWATMTEIVGKPLDFFGETVDCDMALMLEPSGLAVLDCDVRLVERETGHVVRGNSVRLGDLFEARRGVDDLARVAREEGQQVPPTLTVRTKSGGHHLIFLQNPDYPLRTRKHREGWCIDVKAGSGWVACPPTAGYRVVRDVPAVMMPDWLGEWILTRLSGLDPVGGKKRRNLEAQSRMEYNAAKSGGTVPWVAEGTSLVAQWIASCEALIRMSNQHGDWNATCWQTAKDLYSMNYKQSDVDEWIVKVAEPWNASETSKLRRTLLSAWRSHMDENGYCL